MVVVLPESTPGRADFVSREFDELAALAPLMAEVDVKCPGWRLVSVCHVEDLPLLMEPPVESDN